MSAFTINKDTIDLVVSAAVIGGRPTHDPGPEAARDLVAHADRIGQKLWDANYAAVNHRYGLSDPVPTYEWAPVAELMGYSISPEKMIQIERSRLCIAEQSCDYPRWDGSSARVFLDRLGEAIARRLTDWPMVPSVEHSGVMEYAGLSDAAEVWERGLGFKSIARPAGPTRG